MVTFPEIQDFMEHERWGECIFCQAIDGHPCPDSTYMVPESIYHSRFPNMIQRYVGETFIVEGQKAVLVGYCSDSLDRDCIVGFENDKGWEGFDEDDILLSDEDFESYWYIPFDELIESRSE